MGFGRVVIAAFCVVALGGEAMANKKGGTRSCASVTNDCVTTASSPSDGTGNLSKQHRDDLVRKLGAIKNYLEASKATDTNAVQLLRFAAEVEKEVRTKKYGLVFEEHKERVDVELEHNLPVLTEDKKRFIDNGGEVNFLIEGDNLAALKLLEKTHRGRIDLIYIDPPYNTGNKDFVYNDCIIDSSDMFRHSKWLSFMEKRLRIARTLLSKKGAIFISIDDNEQANLKLLCDSIFDEANFIANVIPIANPGGRDYKQIAVMHEYLLVYGRTDQTELNELAKEVDFELFDANGGYALRELRNRNPKFHKGNRPNLFYPIYVNPSVKDGAGCCMVSLSRMSPNDVEVCPYNSAGKESVWRWGRDLLGRNLSSDINSANVVAKQKRDGGWNIYEKCRKTTSKAKSLWDETEMRTEDGTRLMRAIFGEDVFEHPKPLSLLQRCCQLGSRQGSTVLDFFAGSGTTGHAVMNLNAKDGGKRKFILVTNNENGICEKVTYERLKRVIEKENYAARLKYYKIGYVPIDEKVYYEYANDLLKHIRELVELENAVDFSKDKTVAIALTDKELEKFVGNDKRLEACKAVYVGHDVLIGSAIKATLKKHGVKVNIIPQYYYPELEG